MAQYLVFSVAPDGRYTGFRELKSDSDAQAIKAASQLVYGGPSELWCGGRFVARVDGWDRGRTAGPTPAATPDDDPLKDQPPSE